MPSANQPEFEGRDRLALPPDAAAASTAGDLADRHEAEEQGGTFARSADFWGSRLAVLRAGEPPQRWTPVEAVALENGGRGEAPATPAEAMRAGGAAPA